MTDSFKLEKYRYRERSRKFRNWHVLDLTLSGCHLKTYDKALTEYKNNATYPEPL